MGGTGTHRPVGGRDAGARVLPAAVIVGWVEAGARLVGGCCGLGPEAVRGIAEAVHVRESG
jgi:homocysteine S-methyltransferase